MVKRAASVFTLPLIYGCFKAATFTFISRHSLEQTSHFTVTNVNGIMKSFMQHELVGYRKTGVQSIHVSLSHGKSTSIPSSVLQSGCFRFDAVIFTECGVP